MTLSVYSFDPGLTTGWAHLSIIDNEVSQFSVGQGDHFEIGDMLWGGIKISPDIETIFVCESFQQDPRKTQASWSTETIGLVRYWAYYYSADFHLVSSSEHKSLIKNETIKRAGLWSPGMPHAMDAVRVGIYWLVKERRLLTRFLRRNDEGRT